MSSQDEVLIFIIIVQYLFVFFFGDSDKQNIFDQRQKIKSIVINMLQNYSYKYYSHNSNIKYVSSTFECIDFE